MALFFRKFPGITLVLTNIICLASVIISVESMLRFFSPFRIATIGHKFSDNAELYGWGYSPHEMIKTVDADTKVKYISYANNHGWRDLDREYENKKGAYRVLVLGDSVTYGATIPAENIYSRVLEKKMTGQGYNVEVINMAYGAWGTDQELEALKNEGLKYKPHLIIVQFSNNDIADNSYFRRAFDKEKPSTKPVGLKPFYYEIDDQAILHKKSNPYFMLKSASGIKNFIDQSEILKRLYAVYLVCRHHRMADVKYRITNSKIDQLELAVHLKKDSKLYRYLMSHMDDELTPKEISQAIQSAIDYQKSENVILKILGARWPEGSWDRQSYYPEQADVHSSEWRLYLAIMAAMKNCADSIHADIAVLSVREQALYEWQLSWYRISDDPVSKKNFLNPTQTIKSAMGIMGIDVIENTLPYERAQNDPHPNIEGHEAMAEDVFKYLMLHKEKELEAFKSKTL